MKRIKILYTIPNFDTAGSGKVLYDLAKGLDATKFEVEIACNNNKGAFFTEVEKLGLPIHFMNVTTAYNPYFSLLFRMQKVIKFFKKNKYDIIHSWHWSSDWTEVLASRMSGAKFIYTKKAMTWGNIHWKIRSYLANYIITINEDMSDYFLYKKNQKLIPLGLDTNYYNPDFFRKKTDNSTFKIITVANLVSVKNIELIINAIYKLQKSNIFLDIVGDNTTDYAKELEQLVLQYNLENQIKFLGKHTDVREFLSQSDLYIISSKKEGLPMALVEAMAMAIPVLASKISGNSYVLQNFQELLFDLNETELANKINWMIEKQNEQRAFIGLNLRNYVMKNFSIQSFISAHQNLYQNSIR